MMYNGYVMQNTTSVQTKYCVRTSASTILCNGNGYINSRFNKYNRYGSFDNRYRHRLEMLICNGHVKRKTTTV
jgi:hypothetical protein